MKTFATCLLAVFWATIAVGDALDRIRDNGRIVIGFRSDAPPFSYLSDLNEPTGLAVFLCKDVAVGVKEALGLTSMEVDYHPVTAKTRFEKLAAGEIDILCGPTTATLTRRETMDFSIPYFIDGSSVVFRGGEAELVDDLDGLKAGVLGGTTTERIVKGLLADRGLEVSLTTYDSHVEGLTALTEGDVSAYFGDQAILRYQLGRMRPLAPLTFSAEQFSFEPYALTMARGESELRLIVDTVLSETFTSGRIYTHVSAALGEVTLSDLALSVYQIVALPR